MRDHHALGFAGRARGIDQIGQIIGRSGYVALQNPGRIGEHRFFRVQAQISRSLAACHNQGCAGIFQHIGQPGRRVGWVQRQISGAGLQDSQHCDDQISRSFQTQTHDLSGASTACHQCRREPPRPRVQFGISQAHGPRLQRRSIGGFDRDGGNGVGHTQGRDRQARSGQCGAGPQRLIGQNSVWSGHETHKIDTESLHQGLQGGGGKDPRRGNYPGRAEGNRQIGIAQGMGIIAVIPGGNHAQGPHRLRAGFRVRNAQGKISGHRRAGQCALAVGGKGGGQRAGGCHRIRRQSDWPQWGKIGCCGVCIAQGKRHFALPGQPANPTQISRKHRVLPGSPSVESG